MTHAEVIGDLVDSDFSTDRFFDLIRQLATLSPTSEEFRSKAGYVLYKRCQTGQGLPNDLCELLEQWLTMPWDSEDGLSEDVDKNETDEQHPTSVLWSSGREIIHTDRSFWPLLAVTNGYLMKSPPETLQWLRLLDRLLNNEIATDTWTHYCSELRWINLSGCDRKQGNHVIAKLFDKHPTIGYRPEGTRLIAMVSHHLSQNFVRGFLDRLLNSERSRHRQAYGEILTLLALRGEPHEWASIELQILLDQMADDVEQAEPIVVGVAFVAAHLWDETEAREDACQLLCRIIPHATERIGDAIGTVFWATDDFLADNHTDELLRAIAKHPRILSGQYVPDLVEHLAKLLPECRKTVLDVSQAIVETRGSELASLAYELYLSGPHLVNIAMTLQRFTDTRSEALAMLEKLLEMGLDDAFTILHEVDIRPISMKRREPRQRRRRRRRRMK